MNYYDEIANGYDELYEEEQNKKLAIVKENIDVNKDTKLLDVGCGSGLSSDFDCDVTGIDPSEKLLELAQKRNPIGQFILGEAEELPFDDTEFDVVISLSAIQNFDDIAKGLSEINRVGKNKFALSYMKKTEKAKEIEKAITETFKVDKRIEEDKDVIFFCSKA